MRKVALFVVTDGRMECLKQTLASLSEKVKYDFAQKFIVCDSLDENVRREVGWLGEQYGMYVMYFMVKAGFAGVYNAAWKEIQPDITHVFNSEDDFTYNVPVDIEQMIKVLDTNTHLVQLCLKRQPWNEQEKQAGGIIECWPDLYIERKRFIRGETEGENTWMHEVFWSEHNLFYSTNPSLTPKFVIDREWPFVGKSEEFFSKHLFRDDPKYRAAYWGKKFDPPAVHHIGSERVGTGY